VRMLSADVWVKDGCTDVSFSSILAVMIVVEFSFISFISTSKFSLRFSTKGNVELELLLFGS